MPAREADPTAVGDAYGGFVLGSMHLALPMTALREVVLAVDLGVLPYGAPCLLGGVNLRGSVVPVVDLRVLLGRPREQIAHPCVVIMVHEGRLLGLLAERVTGIFRSNPGDFREMTVAQGSSAVVAGSLYRNGRQELVSVLSASLLATVADVPMVEDARTAGRDSAHADGDTIFDVRSVPVMLMRCQKIAMAIDAMAVHSTLSNPAIARSNLADGVCRGTIDYTGLKVPAIDLSALCGFGRLAADLPVHAFVLQLDAGYVAFLVDEVIDVVRTHADHVVALARYALPEPELFAGALPAAVVKPVFNATAGRREAAITQYLLLDTAALKASALVAALAATNVPASGATNVPMAAPTVLARPSAAPGATRAGASPAHRSMIIYDVTAESATPLEQIVEVLSFDPKTAIFTGADPLVGLVVNRGRSVPLFCLRRLAGAESPQPGPDSRVLVVQSGDDCIGFVVPRVRAIDTSDWTPALPSMGAAAGGRHPSLTSGMLASVGRGAGKRMVPLVNLEALAAALAHFGRNGTGEISLLDSTSRTSCERNSFRSAGRK